MQRSDALISMAFSIIRQTSPHELVNCNRFAILLNQTQIPKLFLSNNQNTVTLLGEKIHIKDSRGLLTTGGGFLLKRLICLTASDLTVATVGTQQVKKNPPPHLFTGESETKIKVVFRP